MRRRSLLVLALLPLSACIFSRKAPPPPANGLTDANIAAIVVAANNVDIQYAQQAKGKSKNPDILGFAEMTFKDHTALNAAATALATKLALTPVANETALNIRDDGDIKREKLRELDGAAFDSAYAENEFAYHQTVWDVIEKTLIPSAVNPELKALLLAAQPAVGAHKQHAMNLRAKFVKR
jgi:putative membrane protein